jgi:histidyl-tRNA synthetase
MAGLNPDQVNILINDRSLVDLELGELGIESHIRPSVLRLIDRQDKMPPDQWHAFALDIGLTEEQFSGIQAILSNKELWKKSPDLRKFFQAIQASGMSEWVKYAPNIIRGLDYYTRIVMEAWDKDGEFRAILGGGRYDNLVKDMGGEPISGVGFAMGDLTTSLVLKKFNCIPKEISEPTARVLVTIFDEETSFDSLSFANELRKAGINVSCYPEATKISKQFKYGDRRGYKLAVVLGPDEITQLKVTIKDLQTGDQETIDRNTAPIKIKAILKQAADK